MQVERMSVVKDKNIKVLIWLENSEKWAGSWLKNV